MLIINARNEGEGAYEAELFVLIPEEADYVGIERNSKVRLESTDTKSDQQGLIFLSEEIRMAPFFVSSD